MNFFTFDVRKILFVIFAIGLPLLLVNLQRKSEDTLLVLKPFTLASGLVQKAYSSFSAGVRGTTGLYLDLIDIKKENRLLLNENQELRAQLGALTELRLENERLNSLLQFKQRSEMELLAARVIGKDLLPDHNTITINRGSAQGVNRHMAVITVGGVVGYVFRVETHTARILLLTDRYTAIDAIVQRSRARGIVEGTGGDDGRMRYLRRDEDVIVGDLIVTSGLDNIFPKGFPVGTVISVNKSRYGMTQEVGLRPVLNPSSLEEVFVVLNANHEEFAAEELASHLKSTEALEATEVSDL